MMYPGSNIMVKRIWSENLMIKKVYMDSMISGFGYQSLRNRNEKDLVWTGQKIEVKGKGCKMDINLDMGEKYVE